MCTLLRSLWVYNDLYEHTMISVSIQWSLWVYNDLYENTMISMSIQWSLWEYNDLYEYTMISMSFGTHGEEWRKIIFALLFLPTRKRKNILFSRNGILRNIIFSPPEKKKKDVLNDAKVFCHDSIVVYYRLPTSSSGFKSRQGYSCSTYSEQRQIILSTQNFATAQWSSNTN